MDWIGWYCSVPVIKEVSILAVLGRGSLLDGWLPDGTMACDTQKQKLMPYEIGGNFVLCLYFWYWSMYDWWTLYLSFLFHFTCMVNVLYCNRSLG